MTHSFGSIVLGFFKDYLSDVRGLSENTLASYSDCMRLLFNFTADKLGKKVEELNIEDIDDATVVEFLNHLETKRDNKAQTRNQRLAVVKTFFNFIASKFPELINVARKISVLKPKKFDQKSVQPLYENELNAIFSEIESIGLNGARDLALLKFMYNTGARVQEVVDIRLKDLRMEAPYVVKIHGKGNKERIVVLFPETVAAIQDYLEVRMEAEIESEFLFINKYGTKMTRQGVSYILTKYADMAAETTPSLKERTISPHTIRHTTAFHLIKAGNDITIVKDWLGHEDINTTAGYVTIDIQMKEEALDKINIFSKNGKKTVSPKWRLPKVLGILKNLSRKKPALC